MNGAMNGGQLKTLLFVPASRPERIAKAMASGAGAVIVDLEDAVAVDAKASARDALDEFLETHEGPPIYVRINARGTPEFEADLSVCQRHTGVGGIMLPKAESASDIESVGVTGKSIIPLIESAAGLVALNGIATARSVERLSYGGLDLCENLGIEASTEGADTILDHCRCQLLISSRAAGLQPPVETVFPVFNDVKAMHERARRARNMGFGAILCIHPKQIEPAQTGFSPEPEQVEWARKVVAAAEAHTGAFTVDGQMVDAPVIAMARTILGRAI